MLTAVANKRVVLALLATLLATLLAGCGALPTTVAVEYEHVSHPMAGWPFGPSHEEDTLDHINVIGTRRAGRAYVQYGLGYKLRDGGLYGPEVTGTVRVGVELWRKDK